MLGTEYKLRYFSYSINSSEATARDVWTADASVSGSSFAGSSADTDGRGFCSMTNFADAD